MGLLTTFSSGFSPFAGLLELISILFVRASNLTQLPADVVRSTRSHPGSFWMSRCPGRPDMMLVFCGWSGFEFISLGRYETLKFSAQSFNSSFLYSFFMIESSFIVSGYLHLAHFFLVISLHNIIKVAQFHLVASFWCFAQHKKRSKHVQRRV